MKLRKTDLLLYYAEQEEMLPSCCKSPNVVFYYLANSFLYVYFLLTNLLFLSFIFP